MYDLDWVSCEARLERSERNVKGVSITYLLVLKSIKNQNLLLSHVPFDSLQLF